MTKYIILLRGINVGGHRKILMKDLKELLAQKGFSEITTYIQSGNIICESNKKNIKILESLVQESILEKFGHDVPVIIRTAKEWLKLVANNPYQERDINELYCAFLADTVDASLLTDLVPYATKNEIYQLLDQQLYLAYPIKVHQSKLSNNIIEKKLNTTATVRNWKTVLKLAELSK